MNDEVKIIVGFLAFIIMATLICCTHPSTTAPACHATNPYTTCEVSE